VRPDRHGRGDGVAGGSTRESAQPSALTTHTAPPPAATGPGCRSARSPGLRLGGLDRGVPSVRLLPHLDGGEVVGLGLCPGWGGGGKLAAARWIPAMCSGSARASRAVTPAPISVPCAPNLVWAETRCHHCGPQPSHCRAGETGHIRAVGEAVPGQ
jgi:hypothetical protein